MTKIAIFLLSGVGDVHGTAAFHALLYARDLKAANIEVKMIFDGAGTGWVEQWAKPDHRLHGLYEETRAAGIIEGVCRF